VRNHFEQPLAGRNSKIDDVRKRCEQLGTQALDSGAGVGALCGWQSSVGILDWALGVQAVGLGLRVDGLRSLV
jgi:hypothetical protein